ncbi:MAG: M20/M25/M40 family metallo-hydrolase [Anaerolineaceae bacterium]|nr:M20/M25/M40 family metallo-hydrolase [Anaerolineaceae bacterium]
MFDLNAHLRAMVELHAPSGHEGPLRDYLSGVWEPLADELSTDGLGSLIATKRPTRECEPSLRIMLAAHMDEIGLMAREVVDGFISLQRINGVDNRVLPAQAVIVHGRRQLHGVVAAKPPHMLPMAERQNYEPLDNLLVDVGLEPAEVEALVQPGDLITQDAPMIELQNGRLAGKAMDDRASLAALTVCLQQLQTLQHGHEVCAVATAQEETGLLGARTAAWRVKPDLAIALDVDFAVQPGVEADNSVELGKGPGLPVGPNFHRRLVDRLRATARSQEIPLQGGVISGASGTDAWAIQVARAGVPTALLGIPLRNMHSPVETLDPRDIERAGRLLAHFIAEVEGDFLLATNPEGGKS